MSGSFDVNSLAGDVADAFRSDTDDYSYSRSHDGADALLKLIRAVVRQEVEAHALRSREDAEAYSKAEAEAFHEQEYERDRCEFRDPSGRRCRRRTWHVNTTSNLDHSFDF